MFVYQDMKFCRENTCSKFGDGNDDCPRSLTVAVEHMANNWWDGKDEETESAPICILAGRPDCYEKNHS